MVLLNNQWDLHRYVNLQDTRASSGYALRGIARHETLQGRYALRHHEPTYHGGMAFVARVLLTCAGAAGFLAGVEVVKRVWMF